MATMRFLIAFLFSLLFVHEALLSDASEKPTAAEVVTGLNDQAEVAITIYNANLGLVRDQRNLRIPKGRNEIKFMDVASSIIPTSVHIKSLTSPANFTVLEQNYEYDLINTRKLLDKYVGRDLKLYHKNYYTEREEVVTATLLSNNDVPIYRIGGEITFNHPGRIILPEIPKDMVPRPTLLWLIDNTFDIQQTIEATYLTDNINWKANYVMTLNDRDDRADIAGWVTIDNKSGATYANAKVKLVAGDVNRIKEERDRVAYKMTAAREAAPQFKEEAFFEYHLYTLQRPTTVKDKQTKQISFLSASNVPVTKQFIVRGERYHFSQMGEPVKQKVGVYITLENTKKNNLGMPLPKGIVRTNKKDSEGSLQFVGEDSIDHTPENEKIRVKLGDAFDVVSTRKQTEWKKIAYDTYDAAYEISLRNHKKEDITIRVIEPIPGDWAMLASSHGHSKSDVSHAEFVIPVAKDSEVKLTYKVRMRY